MARSSQLGSNVVVKTQNLSISGDLIYQIKRYIKFKKFDEALQLCDDPNNVNDRAIQMQKVKILRTKFEETKDRLFLDQALNVCDQYLGNSDFDIQRGKILIILSEHFHEKINLEDIPAISQIAFFIEEDKLEKALQLCNELKNRNDKNIRAQKVRVLLLMFEKSKKQELLEEALKICEKYIGDEGFDIQRNRIGILLSGYFNKEIDLDGVPAVPQIKFLMDDDRLEEALKLCNDSKNENDVIIQSQKVKILLLLFAKKHEKKLLNDALEVCQKYVGNEVFDIQSEKIKRLLLKYFDIQIEDNNSFSPVTISLEKELNCIQNIQLTDLLTNIYYDTITKQEIENSSVDTWNKILLLTAYYEKNNKTAGASYLKRIKKEYQDIPDKKKILNLLYGRLASKKLGIFDICVYTGYLNCCIDSTFIRSVKKEVEERPVKESGLVNQIDNDKASFEILEKMEPNIKSCTGGIRYNRYNRQNVPSSKKSCDQTCLSKVPINQPCIKDIFKQEVFIIQSYLYIRMNQLKQSKMIIEAWDKFENLIYKPADDREALLRMISLLKRLELAGLVSNIEDKPIIKKLEKKI